MTGADRNAAVVLVAAVIAMGLPAGLFYFSSIAVMSALTAADDRTLVDAMQQMSPPSPGRSSCADAANGSCYQPVQDSGAGGRYGRRSGGIASIPTSSRSMRCG